MKAAVLRGVDDLRLEEGPDPEPASNEALIRVRAAGLCGTDVHMWTGTNQEGTFPLLAIVSALGSLVAIVPWWNAVPAGARIGAAFDFLVLVVLLTPLRDRLLGPVA